MRCFGTPGFRCVFQPAYGARRAQKVRRRGARVNSNYSLNNARNNDDDENDDYTECDKQRPPRNDNERSDCMKL